MIFPELGHQVQVWKTQQALAFVYSFNKYWLGTDDTAGTIPGTGMQGAQNKI